MLALPGLYQPITMTYDSESGSPAVGFEGSNTQELRQGLYWLVPSGGPHTLTLNTYGYPTDVGFVFTSPAGRPIVGDLLVSFVVDPSGAIGGPYNYGPYTLPKYTSENLRDQRILIPTVADPGSDINIDVTITAQTGSCISRAVMINGSSTYFTPSVDGTALDRGWQQGQVSIVRQGRNNAGGVFYNAGFNTAPVRYKTMTGDIHLTGATYIPRTGRRGEIFVLPSAALYTESAAKKELMHKQALFGRRVNNLTKQLNTLSGDFTHALQFKELI